LGLLKRLLSPFKPVLVPLWNGAHLAGWWIAEHGDAVAHGRREVCIVCGRRAWMLLQKRAIPPRLVELWGLTPRQALALARKETLTCTNCGSRFRSRRIAQILLEIYPAGHSPNQAESIASWTHSKEVKSLHIAEFNKIDGLHEQLLALPSLQYSEFVEGGEPGKLIEGVRCEDLTRLTYPDASFDLVLSSETLEHVPDLHHALREVHRILKPGGIHIFTIPRLPGTRQTHARATLAANGTIRAVACPLLHHPGGDVGYLVFTEFGADLKEILEAAGFEAHERFGPLSDDDFCQVWITSKPITIEL